MKRSLLFVIALLFVVGCGYKEGDCVLVGFGDDIKEATYIDYDGGHWFKIDDKIYAVKDVYITECRTDTKKGEL